jgi:TonB family protein
MSNSSLVLIALTCLFATASPAQVRESSVPLGTVLDKALENSVLTGEHAQPFHIKVHLFESTNPECGYCADIEEYWVSPTQWKRSIVSPKLTLTTVVSGDKSSEQMTGDYYPLWLRRFVIGIFEVVPHPEMWAKTGAMISQITLPDGRKSDACSRLITQIGSSAMKNDAFSNVCFSGDGLLNFVGTPGYAMEFHDYKKFGKLHVARTYIDHPESGTELVAKVAVLEPLKHPEASQFAVETPTASGNRLVSIPVPQDMIEANTLSGPPMVWPQVQSGKTDGKLSMYISIDREGHVREAYPLNSDNAGLQDAARDQLLKWQLKPFVNKGEPIQVEAAMSFQFKTTVAGSPVQPSAATKESDAQNPVVHRKIRISAGVAEGLIISKVAPVYPAEARQRQIAGKVVLGLTVDTSGTPTNIHVVSAPDELLAQSAIDALRQWRYHPYLLNGEPIEAETLATINYELRVP